MGGWRQDDVADAVTETNDFPAFPTMSSCRSADRAVVHRRARMQDLLIIMVKCPIICAFAGSSR
jgi:hypothetical protein